MFPEFDSPPGTQPCLQTSSVPKLSDIYAGHITIVPSFGPHCQRFAWQLKENYDPS